MEFKTFRTKHTSLALLAGLGVLSIYLTAAPVYSDWSQPINLGPGVNSAAEEPPILVNELSGASNDLTPAVGHDGLEIIIASNRQGTIGAQDLWVSTRNAVGDPWLAPVNVGPVLNSTFNDNFPSLSSDRETLFFSSDRPGGSGGADIYIATRSRRTGSR